MHKSYPQFDSKKYVRRPYQESKIMRFFKETNLDPDGGGKVMYIWGLGGAGKTWLRKAIFEETGLQQFPILENDQEVFYETSAGDDSKTIFLGYKALSNLASKILKKVASEPQKRKRGLFVNLWPLLPTFSLLYDYGISPGRTSDKLRTDAPILLFLSAVFFAAVIIAFQALGASSGFSWFFALALAIIPAFYGLFNLALRRLFFRRDLAAAGVANVFSEFCEANEDTDVQMAIREDKWLHSHSDYLARALKNDIGTLLESGILNGPICIYADLDYFPYSNRAEEEFLKIIETLASPSSGKPERLFNEHVKILIVSKRRKSFVTAAEERVSHPVNQTIASVKGMSERESKALVNAMIQRWKSENAKQLEGGEAGLLLGDFYLGRFKGSKGTRKKLTKISELLDTGLMSQVQRLPADIYRRTERFLEDHASRMPSDIVVREVEYELLHETPERLFKGYIGDEAKALKVAVAILANCGGVKKNTWDSWVRNQHLWPRDVMCSDRLTKYESFFDVGGPDVLFAKKDAALAVRGDRAFIELASAEIESFCKNLATKIWPRSSDLKGEIAICSETGDLYDVMALVSLVRAHAQHGILFDRGRDELGIACSAVFTARHACIAIKRDRFVVKVDEKLFKLSLELLALNAEVEGFGYRRTGLMANDILIKCFEFMSYFDESYNAEAIFNEDDYYKLLLRSALSNISRDSHLSASGSQKRIRRLLEKFLAESAGADLSKWKKLDVSDIERYELYPIQLQEKSNLIVRMREIRAALRAAREAEAYFAESQSAIISYGAELKNLLQSIGSGGQLPIHTIYEYRKLVNSVIAGMHGFTDVSESVLLQSAERFRQVLKEAEVSLSTTPEDGENTFILLTRCQLCAIEQRFQRFANKYLANTSLPEPIYSSQPFTAALRELTVCPDSIDLKPSNMFAAAHAIALSVEDNSELVEPLLLLYVIFVISNLNARRPNKQVWSLGSEVPEEQSEFYARIERSATFLNERNSEDAANELLAAISLCSRSDALNSTGNFVIGKVVRVIWREDRRKPSVLIDSGNYSGDELVLEAGLMPTRMFANLIDPEKSAAYEKRLIGRYILCQVLAGSSQTGVRKATSRGSQFCRDSMQLFTYLWSSWEEVEPVILGGSNSILTIGLREPFFQLVRLADGVIGKLLIELMHLHRLVAWPEVINETESVTAELVEHYSVLQFTQAMFGELDVYFSHEGEALFVKSTPGIDHRRNRTFLSLLTKNFSIEGSIFGWEDPGRGS